LAPDSADPLDAARAIELCQVVSAGDPYGVLSAAWKLPDGTDPPADKLDVFHIGHGLLADLGQNALPQAGGRLLALSTCVARTPVAPAFPASLDKGYSCMHPAGMPFDAPACPGVTGAPYDGIALEIALQPPRNAAAFTYQFRFYTHEWPQYVC